jgi:DNA-binding transcriptional regulator YiaG
LPFGARRALRVYREAEERARETRVLEDARIAAMTLLKGGKVERKQAEALRLYMAFGRSRLRTYKEIGTMMKISKERVRQLLLPTKVTLGATLSGHVPWACEQQAGGGRTSSSQSTACSRCNNITLKKLEIESCFYLYENCGLQDVVVFGPTTGHCDQCNAETVSIPRLSDLHIRLVKAVLLKPALLRGNELQFVRTGARLTPTELAERVGVTFTTIRVWEGSKTLRYSNDLAARMAIASRVESGQDSLISKIFNSIRPQEFATFPLTAYWINDDTGWVIRGLNPDL